MHAHADDGYDNAAQINEATFEVLQDGSTALVMKPGYRLKLKLSELTDGGDAAKEARAKKAAKAKKKAAKKSGSRFSDAYWDDDEFDISRWFKEYINEYTVTMDIKLLEEAPRDGLALFQTALIHAKENKRLGKAAVSRSDGECIVNQAGGVGLFGSYGDTTEAKVEVGVWKRIVVAVKCCEAGDKQKKGEMKTWIGTKSGAVIKEEAITANERFAIDPDSFFLFSSAQTGMMPGKIAIRTVRVEKTFATDKYVLESRARDKVLQFIRHFCFPTIIQH